MKYLVKKQSTVGVPVWATHENGRIWNGDKTKALVFSLEDAGRIADSLCKTLEDCRTYSIEPHITEDMMKDTMPAIKPTSDMASVNDFIGKRYLNVAGVCLVGEGDICRDPSIDRQYWTVDDLHMAATTINYQQRINGENAKALRQELKALKKSEQDNLIKYKELEHRHAVLGKQQTQTQESVAKLRKIKDTYGEVIRVDSDKLRASRTEELRLNRSLEELNMKYTAVVAENDNLRAVRDAMATRRGIDAASLNDVVLQRANVVNNLQEQVSRLLNDNQALVDLTEKACAQRDAAFMERDAVGRTKEAACEKYHELINENTRLTELTRKIRARLDHCEHTATLIQTIMMIESALGLLGPVDGDDLTAVKVLLESALNNLDGEPNDGNRVVFKLLDAGKKAQEDLNTLESKLDKLLQKHTKLQEYHARNLRSLNVTRTTLRRLSTVADAALKDCEPVKDDE